MIKNKSYTKEVNKMVTYDLVIKSGKVVSSQGVFEAHIFVLDGKIARISRVLDTENAERTLDASGLLVFPGFIDSHVHFRDPGLTHKEDFESGTKSAAAGGVTCVFDMPTTKPVVTNANLFSEKLSIVSSKAYVDFALYGAAGSENVQEVEALARAGAIAFKSYTVSPPAERISEYAGALATTTSAIYEAMEAVSKTGLVHCFHAEDDGIVQLFTKRLQSQGRRDALAHAESRPAFAEAMAVSNVIRIAKELRAKIHIVHVSTKQALEVIRAAKSQGVKVSCETCPQYLFFTKQALQKFGPYAKFNPPARDEQDVSALLDALLDDTVDIVVSDHAPHAKHEKDQGYEDIWKAPPGVVGVELRFPLLFTLSQRLGLSYTALTKKLSTNVAKIFGLQQKKGDIMVGLDADFAIVDPKEEWVVKGEELHTKAKENVLYHGMKLIGKVKHTVVRGKPVYEEGVGFEKNGRFVRI